LPNTTSDTPATATRHQKTFCLVTLSFKTNGATTRSAIGFSDTMSVEVAIDVFWNDAKAHNNEAV